MSRICEVEDCNTKAFFNFPGTKPGKYCGKHRLEGQINIYNKTCAFDDCLKRPLYNIEGEKNGLFCKTHKEEDMIDVKSKKCTKCLKRATYNYVGSKPLYCAEHATEDMVFLHKNKCRELGCERMAKYNFADGPKSGHFCSDHKKVTMIRLK